MSASRRRFPGWRLAALMALSPAAFGAGAIVTAESEGGLRYYWTTDQPSRAAAEEAALAQCKARAQEDAHRGACMPGASADGPNYWAVVVADNRKLGWEFKRERRQAMDGAYAQCARRGGDNCAAKFAAVWHDGGQPGAAVPPVPPVAPEKPPRPATAVEKPMPPPSGKWTRLAGAAPLQFLVDKPTLRRNGDSVTAWVLYAMDDESVANLNEHNCKSGEYRTLAWKHYAAPLGKGAATDGNKPESWRRDGFYAEAQAAVCRN